MKIILDDLTHPSVALLLEEHLADMRSISPPESVHALDLTKLKQPNIRFWTAWTDDALLGCIAIKLLGENQGEIKSMRVSIQARRNGVARALLNHALDWGRQNGLATFYLETGSHEFFRPAHRLYETFGFVYSGPFGGYRESPHSIFMMLDESQGIAAEK
ncbi:MAG: GNAT family N-acetyltransferase [Cellvibrio sp.]